MSRIDFQIRSKCNATKPLAWTHKEPIIEFIISLSWFIERTWLIEFSGSQNSVSLLLGNKSRLKFWPRSIFDLVRGIILIVWVFKNILAWVSWLNRKLSIFKYLTNLLFFLFYFFLFFWNATTWLPVCD